MTYGEWQFPAKAPEWLVTPRSRPDLGPNQIAWCRRFIRRFRLDEEIKEPE